MTDDPEHAPGTVNARLLKLEIEARQDRQSLRDHILASEQATRDAIAQRSGDIERQRIERSADISKAERELDNIKKLINENRKIIEDNTRAIHDANLAGKILVKLAAIVIGIPVVAYSIIKVVQEIFPPRSPMHAVVFYLAVSAILFAAVPAWSEMNVDVFSDDAYIASSYSHPPYHLAPGSKTPGGTVLPEGR